jgi:hypothetical protein
LAYPQADLATCGSRLILRSKLNDFENPRINMMTFQALECPIFKTFIGRRHAH